MDHDNLSQYPFKGNPLSTNIQTLFLANSSLASFRMEKKRKKCPDCSTMVPENNFHRHLQSHRKDKPSSFYCDQCELGFSTLILLYRHQEEFHASSVSSSSLPNLAPSPTHPDNEPLIESFSPPPPTPQIPESKTSEDLDISALFPTEAVLLMYMFYEGDGLNRFLFIFFSLILNT